VKKKPFNNPFGAVKLPEQPAPAPDEPAAASEGEEPAIEKGPAAGPSSSRARAQGLSDEELWALAIEGADPLLDRSAPIRPGPAPVARKAGPLDPDLEAYDELRALVQGEVAFDLSDSDEFIQGGARGLDPRVLRRLRKGEFSVQGHVDLHGLSRDEARPMLEAFLAAARAAKKRCVLVVHGRGLHSKDQMPVLKDALKRWMATARFARHVLAFATARPHDGGAGAVYVLLRRQ
jgi:DNA-nicking Smr family endonuclease